MSSINSYTCFRGCHVVVQRVQFLITIHDWISICAHSILIAMFTVFPFQKLQICSCPKESTYASYDEQVKPPPPRRITQNPRRVATVYDKQTNSMHDSFPYSIATRTTKQKFSMENSQLQEDAKNMSLITQGRNSKLPRKHKYFTKNKFLKTKKHKTKI